MLMFSAEMSEKCAGESSKTLVSKISGFSLLFGTSCARASRRGGARLARRSLCCWWRLEFFFPKYTGRTKKKNERRPGGDCNQMLIFAKEKEKQVGKAIPHWL